jgi:GAF domain-containing protein
VSDRFAKFDPVIETLVTAWGETDPQRIAPDVRDGIELALDGLRRTWGGLAIGLWRAVPDTRGPGLWDRSVMEDDPTPAGRLVLVGFAADASMPGDVQAGFRAATGDVSLEQTAFAIVQAVHAGRLVTATAPAPEALASEASSPGWLRRFGARQSAATPILGAGRLLGTFALASTETIPPDVLAELDAVASRLGAALSRMT